MARKDAHCQLAGTDCEQAFMCWMRLNPKVAADYGIKDCNGRTTIGSMAMQMANAMGANVEWYSQLPPEPDDQPLGKKTNAYLSRWIKKIGRRPSARMKQLKEMPEVMPPPGAAVLRKRGTLPKTSFALLQKLAAGWRRQKKVFTSSGNRVSPLAAVALVESRRLTSFVERSMLCTKHKCKLRHCKVESHQVRRPPSHAPPPPLHTVAVPSPGQVGACAQYAWVCEKDCVLTLTGSAPMHGSDYELNSKLHWAIISCAISFARMQPFFALLGMLAPSETDHYQFKAEIEPILSSAAERSMAEAHERNWLKGFRDFFTVDGGFTASRNAHGCTMCGHAADGSIIAVVHKRLTDEGAKSSKGLETLCYLALLCHHRIAVFSTAVMDGCRDLVAPTLAHGLRAAGDLWHVGKNWVKWAELAVAQHTRRPQKSEADRAPNPRVEAPVIDPERLEALGDRPAGEPPADFVRRRVEALGGTPRDGAAAPQLKLQFAKLARERAMNDAERKQEEARRAYLAEEARRKEAAKVRSASGSGYAAAQKEAMVWRRDLRSMLKYIGVYTLVLRDEDNPETGKRWTDAERGAVFIELWARGCVALILGRRDDPTLKLLKHPVTDIPG